MARGNFSFFFLYIFFHLDHVALSVAERDSLVENITWGTVTKGFVLLSLFVLIFFILFFNSNASRLSWPYRSPAKTFIFVWVVKMDDGQGLILVVLLFLLFLLFPKSISNWAYSRVYVRRYRVLCRCAWSKLLITVNVGGGFQSHLSKHSSQKEIK